MGTTETWWDHTGTAEYWNNIPIRTAKKAFFSKAGNLYTLAKMVYNSITVDFNETAQGGVVIMPNDYSAIMFISPDDRIDYNTCSTLTLGETLNHIIERLHAQPIPSWDKFATWLGGNSDLLTQATGNVTDCKLVDLGSTISEEINIPVFSEFANAAQLFEMIRTAVEPASSLVMSSFQADNAAFGIVLNITISGTNDDGTTTTNTLAMGFLFRE